MSHTTMVIPIALALAVAGCTGGADPSDVGADHAPGDAPIRTSATSYTLREEAGGFAVDVPITFRNTLDEALHIINCRGDLAPSLEKREDDAWRHFWAGIQLMCLSPPILIEPGAAIDDTLRIHGSLPGGNAEPTFADSELEGTYRIVLHNVVRASDAGAATPDRQIAVEHRVSNAFTLRRP